MRSVIRKSVPSKRNLCDRKRSHFVNDEIFIHNDDMRLTKTTVTLVLVIMMIMSLFQVPSIQEWLVSQLHTGDRISADPRIISYTEWTNWDNYFSKLYLHMYKIVLYYETKLFRN
jgi:hypothetical protein